MSRNASVLLSLLPLLILPLLLLLLLFLLLLILLLLPLLHRGNGVRRKEEVNVVGSEGSSGSYERPDQKACWKTGTKRKVSWAGDERRERNRRKDRLLGNSNYTLVETSNPSIDSEKDG